MRNADCSEPLFDKSVWNAMRVLSLMSSRSFCFRMCVRFSKMLFSCLAESGAVVGVALQMVFRRISMGRQIVIVGRMFENLTFIRQK